LAKGATIYRAHLELSHVDRDVYADLQFSLARHPSETIERAIVRLLAFGLRYRDGLEFGRGLSTKDEPDLWHREGDGRVSEWIEVGQPDSKRLIKASRQSTRCLLFAFGEGVHRWRKAQLEGMNIPENLGVVCLDDSFIRSLAAEADRQIRWSMTVAEGTIFLTTGDKTFETSPEIWLGDPLG